MKTLILLLVPLALFGCGVQSDDGRSSGTEMYTVTHDGHKFVLARGVECVAMVHHPSCECAKAR